MVSLAGRFSCARGAFQRFNFLGGQHTPLARLEIAQQQRADAHTNDALDAQANAPGRLADLALAPLAHHHPQPGSFAGLPFQVHFGGGGALTIFQHHAVPPGLQLLFIRPAREQDAVLLLVAVPGMGQAVGQLAIVGEQDQPLALDIQAAHRVERAGQVHQVAHGGARVGRFYGREHAARLVQGHVLQRLGRLDRPPIHQDVVYQGVGLAADAGNLAVDDHAPGGDQGFTGAP